MASSRWKRLRNAWGVDRFRVRPRRAATRRIGRHPSFETLETRLALALSVDISNDLVLENIGAVSATVTRTGDLSLPLTVNLSSSDATEATVPTTVVIGPNQSSASFDVTIVDDALLDDSALVNITASAVGHADASDAMVVRNDDRLDLQSAPALDVINLSPGAQPGQFDVAAGPPRVVGGAAGSEPIVDLSSIVAGDQRRALSLNAVSPDLLVAATLVKVDVNAQYTLSAWARNIAEFNETPLGFVSLDVDKQVILPEHVAKYAYAADTHLAKALSPGDTAIYIADASGWSNDAWESGPTRSLAWFGYTDATGHTYADYTYTRHVATDIDGGLWDAGAIHYDAPKGAYRIDLRHAWTGPTIAAGAAVRNAEGGDKYNRPAVSPAFDPYDKYTTYAATIGGGEWLMGQRDDSLFRPGTAYIQPLFSTFGQPSEIVIGRVGSPTQPGRTAELNNVGAVALQLDVLGKGALGGGPTVAIDSVAPPAHGLAQIVPGAGPGGRAVIVYYSPAGFVGTDVVRYTLRNTANNETYSAAVAVNMLGGDLQPLSTLPSVVRDVDYTILADQALDADGFRAIGLLGNTLPTGAATVRLVAGPAQGSLRLNADGTFVYTPDPGFAGVDVIRAETLSASGVTSVTATIHVSSSAETVRKSRLRALGIAAQSYEASRGRYPLAGTASEYPNDAAQLLSWRVHLLPYLGYQTLYNQFHLNESWNSPHNLALASKMPDVYRSLDDSATANATRLQTIGNVGAPYYWRLVNNLLVGPTHANFSDGTANSIFVVEAGADMAVIWTRPQDLPFHPGAPLSSLGTITGGRINMVMGDGSARTVSAAIDPLDFQALVTISGGEVVDVATLEREYLNSTGGMSTALAEVARDNAFKQLAIAMLNYESAKKSFPVSGPRSYVDAAGNPLVSWRVHLLPYMGYTNLYSKFKLDEPWNSANNLPLLAEMPDVFRSVGDAANTTTTRVQSFYGVGAAFRPMPGTSTSVRGLTMAQIADGTANTLMLVETGAGKAVPWTKPEDVPFDAANPLAALAALGLSPADKIRAAMVDGSVVKLPASIDPAVFTALVTIAGREGVDVGKLVARDAQLAGYSEWPSIQQHKFKQIVLAMLNYESARAVWPSSSFAADGTPLLSWRVHILPYLDQQDLYNKFRKNEPWDSPHNLALLDEMPDFFRMEGDAWDTGLTRAETFTGPGAPFPAAGTNTTTGPRIHQVIDGMSNTFSVVDAGLAVPWTKPADIPFHANNPFSALGELGPNFLAAQFDGAVLTQLSSMSMSQLAAYITHRGGEDVDNPPTIANANGLYVRQTGGDTRMNEFGVDWFDVVLDKAPAANVTVSLSISNSSVATLDKATLSFTPANWNTSQRVAVRAVDNAIYNADETIQVTVSAPGYADPQMFSVTVRNDDPHALAGDFNDDARVDGADFLAWQRGLGTAWPAARTAGDADVDRDVDAADLRAWNAQFGAVAGDQFAADFDDDGHIGAPDFAAWSGGFGTADGAPLAAGDADFDGDIDGRDFLAWQRTLGGGANDGPKLQAGAAALPAITVAGPAMLAGLPSLAAAVESAIDAASEIRDASPVTSLANDWRDQAFDSHPGRVGSAADNLAAESSGDRTDEQELRQAGDRADASLPATLKEGLIDTSTTGPDVGAG